MQYHLKVGTTLQVKGSSLDDYVIEKIRTRPAPDGKTFYTIEARTVRQRCFDRLLTGYTSWPSSYVLDCLNAGTFTLKEQSS